jgi:hypothetical protein
VRSVKATLTAGVLLALLTVYVYAQSTTETFIIYLVALIFWAGLSGYCVHSRDKAFDRTKH